MDEELGPHSRDRRLFCRNEMLQGKGFGSEIRGLLMLVGDQPMSAAFGLVLGRGPSPCGPVFGSIFCFSIKRQQRHTIGQIPDSGMCVCYARMLVS